MATDSVARALALSAGGGSNLPSIESGDAGKVLKVNEQETGTYWGDDGNEPDAYIKNASVSGDTLTLTKKDNTTVTFEDTTYSAGNNVSIVDGVISATDTTYTAGENITITNNVISATGGGSTEDCVKMVPQVISDAQFNQAMTNLGLGAGRVSSRVNVAEWSGSQNFYSQNINLNLPTVVNPAFVYNKPASVKYDISITVNGVTYTVENQSKAGGGDKTYLTFVPDIEVETGKYINFIYIFSTYIRLTSYSYVSTWNVSNIEIKTHDEITEYTKLSSNYYDLSPIEEGDGDSSAKSKSYFSNGHEYGVNTVIGKQAAAFGGNNNTSGTQAICLGSNNTSSNQGSISIGGFNSCSSDYSTCIGLSNYTGNNVSAMSGHINLGKYNEIFQLKDSYGAYYSNGVTAGSRLIVAGSIPSNSIAGPTSSIALGCMNVPVKGLEWYDYNKTYNTNDKVLFKDRSGSSGVVYVMKSRIDNNVNNVPSSNGSTTTEWQQDSTSITDYETYLLTVGNGKFNYDDSPRSTCSNALAIDYLGNTEIAGTVTAANIPAAPASDGNYVLKCSIVSGVATYSWVAES